MSPFHPDDPSADLNRLARSIELWPDPFDSPEVPGESVLRSFLEGKGTDPDIQAHIGKSVDCQRAISLLRRESENQEERKVEIAAMRCALLEAAVSNPTPVEASDHHGTFPRPVESNGPPQAGELFATASKIEQWNGKQLVPGFTFKPLDVLLLDEGHAVPCGDTIFRAVACSPADHWPPELRADDESVADFGPLGEFVIHWWLNYPVSVSQLTRKIGEIQDRQDSGPILPEDFQTAGSEPDPRNEELWLERDRLHACAAYLGANAHARRMAADEADSGPESAEKVMLFSLVSQSLFRQPKAAAGKELLSGLAIVSQAEWDRAIAKEAQRVEETPGSREEGYAEVVTRPTRDRAKPDFGFVQWEIHPSVSNARRIHVIDSKGWIKLGQAILSKDGKTVTLENVSWALLQPYHEDPVKLRDVVVAVITDA